MSRTFKTAALAALALASLSAGGTASAVTLNHHAAPAARTTLAEADDAAMRRPAVNAGSTSVGPQGRNCTRGHLSHGHC